MIDSLYAKLSAWGSWPFLALLIVVAVLCSYGFDRREQALEAARAEQPEPNVPTEPSSGDERCKDEVTLDGCLGGYSRAAVHTLLDVIGEKGRRIYGLTELSLDLVYPLTYGLLFAILLAHLFTPRQAWVLYFPLAAVTFDVLENVTVAVMALTYDGGEPALAGAASSFTITKAFFLLISFLLVLFGALRGLFGRRA